MVRLDRTICINTPDHMRINTMLRAMVRSSRTMTVGERINVKADWSQIIAPLIEMICAEM